VLGGLSNVAQGGKFQDGFLSAAASAAVSNTGLADPKSDLGKSLGVGPRTTIAAIAGGTASQLGGGKFANGAITGAMHHLLNAEGDHWHHLYIQSKAGMFREWFTNAGIDIDAKENGRMVSLEKHIGKGGMHPGGWNKDWEIFRTQNPNASKDQMISFKDKLLVKYAKQLEGASIPQHDYGKSQRIKIGANKLALFGFVGVMVGMNESANAMGNYAQSLRSRNFTAAEGYAQEVVNYLPGTDGQKTQLYSKLNQQIEDVRSYNK
jgi:hypothetical protein